ncbi:hypothetical protein B0T25DRAFT_80638 [Lasiosphaeria hispida]|uniref:Uncharacterized protein n=1 Tax=Lasiosphaeria hispida TaxID=260671 RepID=A0AAJ0HPA8_9PEZI|nr:hypothetical protein B0T25DRAFT_80638 [Lasiosphaeria hispida]
MARGGRGGNRGDNNGGNNNGGNGSWGNNSGGNGNRGGNNGGNGNRGNNNGGSTSRGGGYKGKKHDGRGNNSNNNNQNQYQSQNSGPRFVEGIHTKDLERSDQTSVHQQLLALSDAKLGHYKVNHQAFHAGFTQDGSGHTTQLGLWDLLDHHAQPPLGFCEFLHEAGIKHDVDGDTIFADCPEVCDCLTGNYRIPECFLRAFFYLICSSNYRRGKLAELQPRTGNRN